MNPTTTESDEVREIIEAWAAGVRARDIDAVLRRHSNDLLMFDVVGPLRVEGLEAYKRTWLEQFFPWHGGTGRFDLLASGSQRATLSRSLQRYSSVLEQKTVRKLHSRFG
jgi:ketosteroid isomerase-like protein